jgi:hypothetical protein
MIPTVLVLFGGQRLLSICTYCLAYCMFNVHPPIKLASSLGHSESRSEVSEGPSSNFVGVCSSTDVTPDVNTCHAVLSFYSLCTVESASVCVNVESLSLLFSLVTHAPLYPRSTGRRHSSAPAADPPRDRHRSPSLITSPKPARAVSPVDAPPPSSGGLGQCARERCLGGYVWRT